MFLVWQAHPIFTTASAGAWLTTQEWGRSSDLMDLMDLWTPQSRQSLEKIVGLGWFHSFKMLKSILDPLQFAKVNQEVLMFDRF